MTLLVMCTVGCAKSGDDVNELIKDHFSLSNKNIVAYYLIDDELGVRDGKVMIVSEAFDDYSKADSRLVDEQTYLRNNKLYKEWIAPLYEASFNELYGANYSKVDSISGKDNLVVYFKNLDSGYLLYVYEDNIIKLSDGNASTSYKSDIDFSNTYDTFEHFSDKVQKFNNDLYLLY